jgi:hypothetical protein
VKVQVTSNLNEPPNTESWGIRDLFLYIAKCAKDCGECTGPSASDCTKCQNDYAIQDGECKPLANFILLEQSFMEKTFSGLNGWTLASNKGGATHSQCAGTTLVGGFNIFGVRASATKTFDVPRHKRVRLMVQLWKIDSWDNEWFFVQVDGMKIYNQRLGFANKGRPMCGQGHANWNELILNVDKIF